MKPQKINSCLWFDDQAEQAAAFYVSLFDEARIVHTTPYRVDTPSNKPVGSIMTVDFEVNGYPFTALNGGPHFTPNPSISFFMNFDPSMDENASKNLDRIWDKLSSGGEVLMELDEYPFSPKYGWVQDRYGISWQLMLTNPAGDNRPFIVPSLLFCNENTNKAEEAVNFYTSIFKDSAIGTLARYPEDTGPAEKGSLMYGDFRLGDTWIAAMDSGIPHGFNFNEGISLVIPCDTQDEIDYYWEQLSAQPEAEMCGWLKDPYGLSWQVVPAGLDAMIRDKDKEKGRRVTEALLQMKKLDINRLQEAAASQSIS